MVTAFVLLLLAIVLVLGAAQIVEQRPKPNDDLYSDMVAMALIVQRGQQQEMGEHHVNFSTALAKLVERNERYKQMTVLQARKQRVANRRPL